MCVSACVRLFPCPCLYRVALGVACQVGGHGSFHKKPNSSEGL